MPRHTAPLGARTTATGLLASATGTQTSAATTLAANALTLSALTIAGLALPTPAIAAPLSESGRAAISSVDGPGRLTIRAGKRTLPVRLFWIDLPQAGECGAAEATAALRGFARRAPGRLRYEMISLDERRYARDPDGRYLAAISYKRGMRELGADLIAADWARPDEPSTSAVSVTHPEVLYRVEDLPGERRLDGPRPRRGLWALCGGRTHLPLGQPVPTTAAATWTITEQGIATAIGPITPPATLTPDAALTARQLLTIAPADVTRDYSGCRIWLPSLQVRAYVYVNGTGRRCDDGYVTALSTTGPDPAPMSRGGATGDLAATLRARFPLLKPEKGRSMWLLAGPNLPQWAWQTTARISADDRIDGLVAFAAPTSPLD